MLKKKMKFEFCQATLNLIIYLTKLTATKDTEDTTDSEKEIIEII